MIISYKGKSPKIAKSAFIAENAVIIGDVEIGENSSVWFGAVLRADSDKIVIGENTNIQDNCTVHVDTGCPAIIGSNVTVGHNAILHGCTLDDYSLVGMGATVLNNAHIKTGSIVGAGALVTTGKEFPEKALIVGSPAKQKGDVSDEMFEDVINYSAREYIELSKDFIDKQ